MDGMVNGAIINGAIACIIGRTTVFTTPRLSCDGDVGTIIALCIFTEGHITATTTDSTTAS